MLISPVKLDSSEDLASSQLIDFSANFIDDDTDFKELIAQSCTEMLQLSDDSIRPDGSIRQEMALFDSNSLQSSDFKEAEVTEYDAQQQPIVTIENLNRIEYTFFMHSMHNPVVMAPSVEQHADASLQAEGFIFQSHQVNDIQTDTMADNTADEPFEQLQVMVVKDKNTNQILTGTNKDAQEDGLSSDRRELNFDLFNKDGVDDGTKTLALEQFMKKSDEKNFGTFSRKIEMNTSLQVVTGQERLADTKMSQGEVLSSQTSLTEVQEKISVPVNHSMWAKTLTDRMVFFASRGIQQASIVLDPPELGPLKVDISTDGDGTLLNFSTHNYAIKELIESNMTELKADFAASGMNLVNVNVNQHESNNHERQERYPVTDPLGHKSVVQLDLGQKHDGLLSVYV